MNAMIFKCSVLMTFELSRSAISRKGALKELKKRFKRPAAGETKLGFEPLSGLSNTPPGVGGWVPEFVGLRLYSLFLMA